MNHIICIFSGITGIVLIFGIYSLLQNKKIDNQIISNKFKLYCQSKNNYVCNYELFSNLELSNPIVPKNKNVLILCHGKFLPEMKELVNYNESYVYTVDIDPNIIPDFIEDIRKEIFWNNIDDNLFDIVIACFCMCHTRDIVIIHGDYIFQQIYRILKKVASYI